MIRVKLSEASLENLAFALGTDTLSPVIRESTEIALTDYKNGQQSKASPARMMRARNRGHAMIRTARQLLAQLDDSVVDMMEAHDRGSETSILQDTLAERIKTWERTWVRRGKLGAPKNWKRRRLLFRLLVSLDLKAVGVKPSYSETSPRVELLREVLRIADRLDRKRPTEGSLRLIRDVYRDYRKRDTWPERSPKRWLYETDN